MKKNVDNLINCESHVRQNEILLKNSLRFKKSKNPLGKPKNFN
jgi:hypothetical protein